MQGTIRNRDVLVHGVTILRHFGLGTYWRCVRAVLRGRACTFLEVVYGQASAAVRRTMAADSSRAL